MEENFFNEEGKFVDEQGNKILIPSETDTGPLFGPYVKEDFLNNSKIINDTMFFVFAPAPYLTYYWTIVRRNLEWFNGYVAGIHNQGILSSKTGARICKMSANLTLGGGLSFQGSEEAEAFLSDFYKRRRTYPKLKRVAPLLNAIGFMLSKVDINEDGELDISFVPGNRYFAQCDSDGNVTSFYSCIVFVSPDTNRRAIEQSEEDSRGYSLVEERFYVNDKPCVRYRVYEGAIIASSPTFTSDSGSKKGLSFEELSYEVQKIIKSKLAGYKLNTVYELPFDNLGARVTRNTFSAAGMDDYACFADSTLADCHTQLYELDLTKTQKNEHKYLNQDFLVMPDQMIMELAGDRAKATHFESFNGYSSINRRIVKSARYSDPTKETPYVYSPALKIAEYNADIMQIHNEIAAQTEFSPVTIAGYLRNGVEKTATEITADENATRLTIRTKRELITEDLNFLNAIILKHYGISTDGTECSTVFKEGSLSNPKLETELIIRKQETGLITHQMAVEEANPQLSKRECERITEETDAEMSSKQSQPFDGLDLISR